jgi:hypothetical protein
MSVDGMGEIGLQDPLQGYDIKVETVNFAAGNAVGSTSGPLVGAFTSLMFKIVNQTETYLPLNSRIPRMLDGEVIVVWSLEQGLVEMNVVSNTFGSGFATAFEKGRQFKVPRSQRFNIKFGMNAMLSDTTDETTFNTAGGTTSFISAAQAKGNAGVPTNGYQITLCRVDTFSFGVAAGRHVVANSWQGTGQHLVQIK